METFGKGKEYSRIEKVSTVLSYVDFKAKFTILFNEYARHIVSSWFLSNTKNEMMKPANRRKGILFVTTDFAENVVVVRKFEVADQYFHRIEILLFGAVSSFVVKEEEVIVLPSEGEDIGDDPQLKLYTASHMISSDYK